MQHLYLLSKKLLVEKESGGTPNETCFTAKHEHVFLIQVALAYPALQG
jgi:hypothetical protein